MRGMEADGVASWRLAYDHVARSLVDSVRLWAFKHWLALATGLNALFVAMALLTPVLAAWGYTSLATPLWNFYHLFCTQEHVYRLMGEPLALCQRNLAIFTATLLGMLCFSRARRHIVTLSVLGYVVLALPMALDGLTQLTGLRESSVELRTFTGVLFGLASIWYLFPTLDLAVQLKIENQQV